MLSTRNILSIRDLSLADVELVLDTARSFEEVNERAIKKLPTLRGRTVVNLFLEPSTRTRTSFELAAKRLSADAVNISGSSSAAVKGESLKDTAKTLSSMSCDLVVIRHSRAGAPWVLAEHMSCCVVNGGDGRHEHPTQALLDLYALRKRLGRLDGLTVGIVGDVAHSRVAGSLVPALRLVGARPIVIAPPTLLPARPDVLGAEVAHDLDDVLPELDVAYMLRVQAERLERSPFPSVREYARYYGMNAGRLAAARPGMVVAHPGPMNRGVEVTAEVADSDRALVLGQVNAGVAVRMALMYLLLGGGGSEDAS